jgi:hypothetical protein
MNVRHGLEGVAFEFQAEIEKEIMDGDPSGGDFTFYEFYI